eukprot:TRINITY_DN15836_c0_g1_i1.p1 TRINITY_DN15836_c0_g1~~TRINITY_DN15836_c0_g1_i1.p1  ORF type:complete len:178 (+),score=47.81 TRINITY_DN15836_c0_g1_i1:221-754(+)
MGSNMEGVDLEDLEARVEWIEARVGARGRAVSIRDKCADLQSRVDHLLSGAGMTELMGQWEQLAPLLLTDDVEEFLMTLDTKRAVVLSCDQMFEQMASMLEQMQQLEQYAELTPELHQLEPKLKPLHAQNLDQIHQGQQFSHRFYTVLKAYNEFVALCSHKFLHWDAALTQLEQTRS